MICHICAQPSIGQCPRCWKFYCGNHGDIYCDECQPQQAGQLPSASLSRLATLRALTSAIDARDPYTAGHSARVGQLAVEIGANLGLSESLLRHLEIGGYLHDIGKIGVRDSVLLKEGELTPEERELIERHPRVGLEILAAVDLAPEVIAFVAGHHERLDGSGYPAGKRGGEIGVIARIAAVSDIYDALTTDYRAGMTPAEATAIIKREGWQGKLDELAIAALEQVLPLWERRRKTDPALRHRAKIRLHEGGVPCESPRPDQE